MKQKSIPLRKCTGCQEMKDKRTLVRVVRSENGEFSVDFTGKNRAEEHIYALILSALKRLKNQKAIERSFKTPVPAEVYEKLREELLNAGGEQ